MWHSRVRRIARDRLVHGGNNRKELIALQVLAFQHDPQ